MARPIYNDAMESLRGCYVGWDLFVRPEHSDQSAVAAPGFVIDSQCRVVLQQCAPFLSAHFGPRGHVQFKVTWPTRKEMETFLRSLAIPEFERQALINVFGDINIIPPFTCESVSQSLREFKKKAEGREVQCPSPRCNGRLLLDKFNFAVADLRNLSKNMQTLMGTNHCMMWHPVCDHCSQQGLAPSCLMCDLDKASTFQNANGSTRCCPQLATDLMQRLLKAFNTLDKTQRWGGAHPFLWGKSSLPLCYTREESYRLDVYSHSSPHPLNRLCAYGANALAHPSPIDPKVLPFLKAASNLTNLQLPLKNAFRLTVEHKSTEEAFSSVFKATTKTHALDVIVVDTTAFLCSSLLLKMATDIYMIFQTHAKLFQFVCHCAPDFWFPQLVRDHMQASGNKSADVYIPTRESSTNWEKFSGSVCNGVRDLSKRLAKLQNATLYVVCSEALDGKEFGSLLHFGRRNNTKIVFFGSYRISPVQQRDDQEIQGGLRPFLFFVWNQRIPVQFDFERYAKEVKSTRKSRNVIFCSASESALKLGQLVYNTKGNDQVNRICVARGSPLDFLTLRCGNATSEPIESLLSLVFKDRTISLKTEKVKRIANTPKHMFRMRIFSNSTDGCLYYKTQPTKKASKTVLATFQNSHGVKLQLSVKKTGTYVCEEIKTAFLKSRVKCVEVIDLDEYASKLSLSNSLMPKTQNATEELLKHNSIVERLHDDPVTMRAYGFYKCINKENREHTIYKNFICFSLGDDKHPFVTVDYDNVEMSLRLIFEAYVSATHCILCKESRRQDELWLGDLLFTKKSEAVLRDLLPAWVLLLTKVERENKNLEPYMSYAIQNISSLAPRGTKRKFGE